MILQFYWKNIAFMKYDITILLEEHVHAYLICVSKMIMIFVVSNLSVIQITANCPKVNRQTLLLHITCDHNIIAIHHILFGFFSRNYYWISHRTFLLDITYSHYCAFLNCLTFFQRRGHILLNC